MRHNIGHPSDQARNQKLGNGQGILAGRWGRLPIDDECTALL